MKKIMIIIMTLFMLGCTTTKDPTPKNPYKLVKFTEKYYETTFCRDSLCANVSSEEILEFLKTLTGEENTTKPGNEVFSLLLTSYDPFEISLSSQIEIIDFVYFDNDIVRINNVNYKVSNISEVKEEFSYLFDLVNQEMKSLRDILTKDYKLTKIDWNGLGNTGYSLTFLDEEYAAQFAEICRNLYYLDYGYPIYIIGGFKPVVTFESGQDVITITDHNGFHVYKNDERITMSKESIYLDNNQYIDIEKAAYIEFNFENAEEFWIPLFCHEDEKIVISSYYGNQDYYSEHTQFEIEQFDLSQMSDYTITYEGKKITKLPFEEDKIFIVLFTKEVGKSKTIYEFHYKGIPLVK